MGDSIAPQVGQRGPDFEAIAVINEDFYNLRSADYRGRYLILLFYPLDFTFVCPTEIGAFSDRYDEFQALNTDILGISIDSQYAHLAWIQTERKLGGVGPVRFPLVSDLKRDISQAYRLLDSQEGVALRGSLILDPEGLIQQATIHNLAVGRSVDETLRSLRAIQHVQRHRDEVCPADWQPGQASLTTQPRPGTRASPGPDPAPENSLP
ncbi:MAG: peroxiredoxin [Synechococcales cyanobacterium RM1_1_8]|nr:peroxiredoxin [Synechococcales cyanobacterium RM1_1_8]